MTKNQAKAFRDKLLLKVIEIVKTENMGVEEYIVQCNLHDVDASLDNGPFLNWIISGLGTCSNPDFNMKLTDMICKSIEKGYLLDISNKMQIEYFQDALVNLAMKSDKEYISKLVEAVMKGYPDTSIFDVCKRMNKAFGFTQLNYFK